MVDGTGLENQQVSSLAGSNPVPSAMVLCKFALKMEETKIALVGFFDVLVVPTGIEPVTLGL